MILFIHKKIVKNLYKEQQVIDDTASQGMNIITHKPNVLKHRKLNSTVTFMKGS